MANFSTAFGILLNSDIKMLVFISEKYEKKTMTHLLNRAVHSAQHHCPFSSSGF